MSEFFHGVKARQQETSVSTPVTASSGIPFIVGTAPVHTVGGKVNTPILCNSYSEAVAALGYSDDWKKYSICEMIYSHFKLFAMSPMVVVNVLDPTKHKTAVEASAVNFVEKQAKLPFEVIPGSVKVSAMDGDTSYEAGKDYGIFLDRDALVVEIIEGGTIPVDTAALKIGYDMVDTSKVDKADIVGGFDAKTKTYSGFELVDQVFPKYRIVPDLLLAPGWSDDAVVSAIMAAKAENINGIWEGKALIDVDCTNIRHYTEVQQWRTGANVQSKSQIVLWAYDQVG